MSSSSIPKGSANLYFSQTEFWLHQNFTEYGVCIVGLQVALEFGMYDLSVFEDSLLIISQIEEKWLAWDTKLISYQKYVSRLIPMFRNISFAYLP